MNWFSTVLYNVKEKIKIVVFRRGDSKVELPGQDIGRSSAFACTESGGSDWGDSIGGLRRGGPEPGCIAQRPAKVEWPRSPRLSVRPGRGRSDHANYQHATRHSQCTRQKWCVAALVVKSHFKVLMYAFKMSRTKKNNAIQLFLYSTLSELQQCCQFPGQSVQSLNFASFVMLNLFTVVSCLFLKFKIFYFNIYLSSRLQMAHTIYIVK